VKICCTGLERATVGVKSEGSIHYDIGFRRCAGITVLTQDYRDGEGPFIEAVAKDVAGEERRINAVAGYLGDSGAENRRSTDFVEVTVPNVKRVSGGRVPGRHPILQINRRRSKAEVHNDLGTFQPQNGLQEIAGSRMKERSREKK
jgi:hypothetical protein